jgi:hypothetical protein
MQKLLITVCLSVVTGVFAMDYASAGNRDGVSAGRGGVSAGGVSAGRGGVSAGGVSASRDGASARSGGATATASRDGASARSGGATATASRDGASARSGGATATASRDGASARSGGATATASRDGASVGGSSVSSHDDGSRGFVNARGDREYDDLGSWMEDLGSLWSGDESPAARTVSRESASTSSTEQVSEARATSSNGEPAVAEASNRKATRQN